MRFRLIPILVCLFCAACADMDAAKNAEIMRDYATAREHLSYLAQRGFPQAQTELGELYMNGSGTPKNPRQAILLFRQAEESENYPGAILDIGKAYRKGAGVPRNAQKAKDRFLRARVLGAIGAYVQLGLLEQDAGRYKSAEDYFNQGLAKGDMGAFAALGNLRIKQKKLKDAENYFAKALASGDAGAWFDMGDLHMLQGKFALAERDFRHGLEKTGMTDAYLKIGNAQIAQGKFKEADDNYKWALQMGVPAAALRIGDTYRDGDGRPADGVRALYWYLRARQMSADGAELKVTHAEKRLQPEEIAQALKMFAAYKREKHG